MIKDKVKVINNIDKWGTKAEKAVISSLDKTATVLRNKAVDNMKTQVAVPKARLLKQVKRLPRARVGSLVTGIFTEHRGVLLHNFPHQATSQGVRVKVSPTGGYKLIKHTFIGQKPLRGSGVTGYIAMRNNNLIKMLMSTPTLSPESRNARINRLRKKKSWGISPLYATSENQMLYDIKERGDLTPMLLTTMKNDFIARFKQ